MKKGNDTMASIWAVNEAVELAMESEKMGILNKSTGRMGVVSFCWRRMYKVPITISSTNWMKMSRRFSEWATPSRV